MLEYVLANPENFMVVPITDEVKVKLTEVIETANLQKDLEYREELLSAKQTVREVKNLNEVIKQKVIVIKSLIETEQWVTGGNISAMPIIEEIEVIDTQNLPYTDILHWLNKIDSQSQQLERIKKQIEEFIK